MAISLHHRVIQHKEKKQFPLLRHWHAEHPRTKPHFRQNPATVAEIEEKLQKRSSTKKLYINLTKEETNTLSETLKSQKKKKKKRKNR